MGDYFEQQLSPRPFQMVLYMRGFRAGNLGQALIILRIKDLTQDGKAFALFECHHGKKWFLRPGSRRCEVESCARIPLRSFFVKFSLPMPGNGRPSLTYWGRFLLILRSHP